MRRRKTARCGGLDVAGILIGGALAGATCGAAIAETAEPADISVALRGALDPEPQSPVDLLLTDWGQGSVYDLDCDGIVGAGDFLLLLQEIANGEVSHRALAPMLAEWGLGSPWDLNCDGTVDIQDMLSLLAGSSPVPFASLLDAWGADTHNDLDCDGTVGIVDMLLMLERVVEGSASPASLDDLLEDWGLDTSVDRNCDGTVGVEEVLLEIEAVTDL